MLKAISNSKFFFIALGVTLALAGARVYAGPIQSADLSATNRHLERIANSLERIQRDGLKIEQSSGSSFRVKVDK